MDTRSVIHKVILPAFSFLLFAGIASSWTGPTATPPSNNVSAPINSGSTDQVKTGGLSLNSLSVVGNTILGAGKYLNFGTTAGSGGYGLRDNSGTLEIKNSGGSWESIQQIVNNYFTLSSQWITTGSDIYYNTGNVGIADTTPTEKLDVSGNVRAVAFLYSSDGRLKHDVRALSGLETLLKLRPVSFVWNEGAGDVGLIAQEVQEVAPALVSTDNEGMLSVDYVRLVPFLVAALQEQQREIESLRAAVNALQQK